MGKDVGFGLWTVVWFTDAQAWSMCAGGGGGAYDHQTNKQHTSSIYCSICVSLRAWCVSACVCVHVKVCGCVCVSFHITATVNSVCI